MADDLGELLDEVEQKFCSPKTATTAATSAAVFGVPVSKATHHGVHLPPSGSTHSAALSDDDLEQIIEDIINDSSEPDLRVCVTFPFRVLSFSFYSPSLFPPYLSPTLPSSLLPFLPASKMS